VSRPEDPLSPNAYPNTPHTSSHHSECNTPRKDLPVTEYYAKPGVPGVEKAHTGKIYQLGVFPGGLAVDPDAYIPPAGRIKHDAYVPPACQK
jgi:hypothetical protein